MASWIDDITPNNPVSPWWISSTWIIFPIANHFLKISWLQVWLSRMDGHMGLANSLALKMAGITHSSEDPDGGTIMRTASGGKS